MSKKLFSLVIIITCLLLPNDASGQSKNSNSTIQNLEKNCKAFVNGKLLNNPKPIYPAEAKLERTSGKVEVAVEIDEKGKVVGIESINGDKLLTKAASEAALKALFSLTMCDGKPTKTIGIITFNFSPLPLQSEFFKPARIEDLSDLRSEDKYYESLLFLTENYQIAFAYSDQKYHPEMPLTKGDFAHFLKQTLQLLDSRAAISNKNLEEFKLYNSFNPYNLQKINYNPISPSTGSLKTLVQEYKIVLADSDGNFLEESPMTQKNVNEIWRGIFGEDVIPINFLSDIETEKEMSRGDFAIYLTESLEILTYKLLP